MNELTEIANNCRTDKGTICNEAHAYTEFYYDYFQKYKETNEKVYILEIGIYHGASLKMFNDFYEGNCEIYAIDCDLSINQYNADNIHTFQLDQNNKQQIEDFLNKIGNIKFDIIIDDGSHIFEHQLHCLLWLYKYLKQNGIYIIEDLHSYKGYHEDMNYNGNVIQSALYFLNFHTCPIYLKPEEANELNNNIDNITINLKHNVKNIYVGFSITSVITFKHE